MFTVALVQQILHGILQIKSVTIQMAATLGANQPVSRKMTLLNAMEGVA